MERLASPTQAPEQFAATGISNVNNVYNQVGKSLQSRLAAHGLTGGGVEGSGMATLEAARGGDVVNVLNQLPLIQRQWGQEDLANAMRMFALRPTGATTSGTSSASGTNETKTSTMDWMKTLMTVGAMAAAPFTGGASLLGTLGTGGSEGSYAPTQSVPWWMTEQPNLPIPR
jgi:hypothetical protein